jgi:thioredoxin-like negative regulator of GroEL
MSETEAKTMSLILGALKTPVPFAALYELAVTLKAQGMRQEAMYRLFSQVQKETQENDSRIDALLDVMDCICGGPWAKSTIRQ